MDRNVLGGVFNFIFSRPKPKTQLEIRAEVILWESTIRKQYQTNQELWSVIIEIIKNLGENDDARVRALFEMLFLLKPGGFNPYRYASFLGRVADRFGKEEWDQIFCHRGEMEPW